MPVKLTHRSLPENAEARIEIIPLIDIMFFLLAAFMLVSLSLAANPKSIPVNLPTATTADRPSRAGLATLTVNREGLVFLDGKPVGRHELATALAAGRRTNSALRVSIRGDRDARHGEIVQVLDWVRAAGIDRVALDIRSPDKP